MHLEKKQIKQLSLVYNLLSINTYKLSKCGKHSLKSYGGLNLMLNRNQAEMSPEHKWITVSLNVTVVKLEAAEKLHTYTSIT